MASVSHEKEEVQPPRQSGDKLAEKQLGRKNLRVLVDKKGTMSEQSDFAAKTAGILGPLGTWLPAGAKRSSFPSTQPW